MAHFQVTCINKRGSHLDPHERIEYIGNQDEKWKLSEDAAIRAIENYKGLENVGNSSRSGQLTKHGRYTH
jgi:hypothetical protein